MSSTDTDTARDDGPRQVPTQSAWGRALAAARNTWRSLTSMRTALVLLFLLALAAIPGALVPQRSLNEQKVDEYIQARPTLGPIMDRLQLFDVFGSVWFTAIYILLFVSLVGCILPRCVEHAKSLRTPPVAAPRNLARLPHHREGDVAASPEDYAAHVKSSLRGWRTETRVGGPRAKYDDEITVSAEKGYLREVGNLVFHISLVGLLVAIGAGQMFGYEGNRIVVANGEDSFCTASPATFDSFRAGLLVDGTAMMPLCVAVDDFSADYLDTGQAEMFRSHIRYQAGDDIESNTWRETEIAVNHPLRVESDRLYLQGHGYAPTFTVTFPNGESRTETIQWQPEDATTFLSSGAMRFDPPPGMYDTEEERRAGQIAIEGLFAPTAFFHGTLLSSSFPAQNDPAVAIDVYKGETGLDTGIPQSIFQLNQELMNQGRLVQQDRVNLYPGESTTLGDGTEVRFDGAVDFVNVQVSHDPAQNWVLVFAITAMAGLVVSLMIKRRRVWVRIHPSDEGADGERRTVVELGGLARTDQAGWGDEFDGLADRLLESAADSQQHTATTGSNRQENTR
ncbi:cytochrome c biogenesis protein ResB [Rhodococcus rhodnii]|uniref:Cytochrome c biogenesis membrane protein n=2 Tax=Rhodococcus rhodnii TaxID=38312 RepID=R7WSQ3_9NOCA|nr:cytochrome c biogenesis protein ResB [Rhodococcus rhodnii]EOM77184.1 cytochrome c biogenesis membrane protein [Rhodococcus rhodnii LMG 5362]TXG91959.1 cytochrome c biogenesis protein ResB [Rhodococcus rhodnii]